MSLKLTGEDSLCCIMKCSVVGVVALGCSLVVGMIMLVQEVVDGGVEIEWNLFNINDFSTSCMLLTEQQNLFNKW